MGSPSAAATRREVFISKVKQEAARGIKPDEMESKHTLA